MSTTTQPPTGTGNFFGLKQQADTAAKVYMDNVGRHDRRALPKEQESRDKMKESIHVKRVVHTCHGDGVVHTH